MQWSANSAFIVCSVHVDRLYGAVGLTVVRGLGLRPKDRP